MTDSQIGELIKSQRLKLGYTQECLSQLTGITIHTIRRYENHSDSDTGMRTSVVIALLDVLGCELIARVK